MNKTTFLILAAAAALTSSGAVEIYVAPDGNDKNDGSAAKPVATLQRALERSRRIERDEPRTIIVRDGFYSFEKPVIFGAHDYDLTVRAEHSRKAVLSGSVKVSGWKPDEEDARFLVADLPFKPEKDIGYMLICGKEDRPIAAYPEKGRMRLKGGDDTGMIGYEETTFPGDADLGALDLASVWVEIPQEWSTTVSLIKEIDAEARTISLRTRAAMSFNQFNQGFRIFNCRMGMTKPGCWMYESTSGRIIYWPREGETAENLNCRITHGGTILVAAHSPGLTIRGFDIEGCAKTMNKEKANPYAEAPILAAIFIGSSSQNVIIEDCEIHHCAAAGIYATKPVRCQVRNCYVHDLGSDGINYFDGGDASDVIGCEVANYGKSVAAATGIYMQLSNVKCVGNHVHHGSGNGVVMWSCNSLFASNELHHVMQQQKDGGGLYGGFSDCVLADNYVHDIGWPGLYIDEGSQRVTYRGNRFENCGWPIHVHEAQTVFVSNNTFKADGQMRFSFQGSGHCHFNDNKIYCPQMITDDPYRSNCDFWGRNEVFLKQPDGTYKSQGLVTLERQKPAPGTREAVCLSESRALPFSHKGEVDFGLFGDSSSITSVGADGYPNVGVPMAFVNFAYDDNYLYVGFRRKYNQLCGYPAMQNFTSRGWTHCDANRVDFAGGLTVIAYPDGTFETSRKTRMVKDDVKSTGGGSCIMRIPLDDLQVPGAKKKLVKLDLEVEDDGLMLTDEAADEVRGPEKKLPPPKEVKGCSIKFNASIWVEDLHELKALYGPDGENYATATLKFGAPPKKRR